VRLRTPDTTVVAQELAIAGFLYRPAELAVELREERWLVRLPDRRLAWFAASDRGLDELRTQRRVLGLLEARCSFAAPRILFESSDGEFDVRTMVPGSADPVSSFRMARDNREFATRAGTAVGAMLAQQHTRIAESDVSPWLRRTPSWPEPCEWVRDRLPRVVDDSSLIARALAVMEAYEYALADDEDRVLVHTDIGFHNLAVDTESHTINGIFDYDAAAWADRHQDFRYLVFDIDRYEMLDGASRAYEAIVGRAIRRDRVLLYNAACAIGFLAYRASRTAEERWCSRTLAEDLRWSRHAIARVLGPRGLGAKTQRRP
jgi:hypothetical protein